MEKLVELLNEAHRNGAMLFGHCIGDFKWEYYAKNHWMLVIDTLGYIDAQYETFDYSDRDICGKDGGFIERLVKNDKININDSDLLTLSSELGCAVNPDIVIMVLSVKDNPLEYLCSILKE